LSTLHRRILGTLAAIALSAASLAQSPMRVVIPAEAGSDWDRAGRALGAAMLSVGAATTVEYANRGEAGGTRALAEFLQSSKGNPMTFLVGGQDLLIAAELDPASPRPQDGTPLARLAVGYFAVFVPPGSPHKTMADLARAFKAEPGSVAWDAGAPGSAQHLLVAYLARTLGADASRIRLAPGGSGATAGIGKLHDLAPAIKAGRVRALAVSAPKAVSGIPALKEQGIDVVFGNWHGLFAAPGLRPSQRDELLSRVKAATAAPAWQALLAERGWTPVYMHGSDYARFLDEESRSAGFLAGTVGLRKRR